MSETNYTGYEIAVIGMSGRFPGAPDVHTLWENIKNGVESISFYTDEQLLASGIDQYLLNNPDYVKADGRMTGKEYFDSHFFGYLPDEAAIMDPQIRLFHQCVWETLEDAGYNPESYKGLIGLYAGAGSGVNWQIYSLLEGTISAKNVDSFLASQLSNKDFLATLVSYKLNLRGPSVVVYTSCSTSLVAIHTGCQALLSGECDMALAGGVSLAHLTGYGYLYRENAILSPDGHCRAFDTRAQGTVGGEGAGVVLLKPLDMALQDRDHIYAVVKASYINNDGWRKLGFTAPSVEGQAEAIKHALSIANVEPESIGFIETHGTGTVLGDPVELEALRWAFGNGPEKFCALGAIKANLGHLDSAAGVAGFIKTVLAIYHRCIPPNCQFQSPNPKLELENSPFYFTTEAKEWTRGKYPRRAGISSFGIGGTNAHITLEEAPVREVSTKSRPYHLFLVSGANAGALARNLDQLKTFLKTGTNLNAADVAYTLQLGRKVFSHRGMLVSQDIASAVDVLSNPGSGKLKTFVAGKERQSIVFMFPGQGAQYVNMTRGLYHDEALFREIVDNCFELLGPTVGNRLKEVLYPEMFAPGRGEESEIISRVNRTEFAQPLLFIVEYALARLLMSWGIQPDVMIGHSVGEYTAACLSGMLSLESALYLVVLRGQFMQQLPAGAMLSIPIEEQEVKQLLVKHPQLSLAAVNAPGLCVVSGPTGMIDMLEIELNGREIGCRRLHTSHAFHSSMMDPILERFEKAVQAVIFQEPAIPFISNLTGILAEKKTMSDPAYWSRHLREAVQFSRGVETLTTFPNPLFIEVGPGKTLGAFIRRHPSTTGKPPYRTVDLVRHPGEDIPDLYRLLERLGEIWLFGVIPDWNGFYKGEERLRIPLPTYAFEKIFYPAEMNLAKIVTKLFGTRSGLERQENITDWFYEPTWKRSRLMPQDRLDKHGIWLLFIDDQGIGEGLSARIIKEGGRVITVQAGDTFQEISPSSFIVVPGNDEHFDRLLGRLKQIHNQPGCIMHMWGIEGNKNHIKRLTLEQLEIDQQRGYYSILALARAIGNYLENNQVEIGIICDHIQDVDGTEPLNPGKSTLLATIREIPREYPYTRCRCIDINVLGNDEQELEQVTNHLYNEMLHGSHGSIIAYRGNNRWIQEMQAIQLTRLEEKPTWLVPGMVFLVTGGLGGIGYILSRYLAVEFQARLIILGRSSLPDRKEWERYMETHLDDEPTVTAIKKIIELENLGAQVRYLTVDVADATSMGKEVAPVEVEWGPVQGIIHAAGIPDTGGLIQSRTREENEAVFAPKLAGTLNLHDLAESRPVSLFFICSSLAATIGIAGQVGYCAANIFQHYLAVYRERLKRLTSRSCRTVSVGWDVWQEVGMSARELEKDNRPGIKEIFKNFIKPGEGVEVFIRAISHSFPRLDISTRDLKQYLEDLEGYINIAKGEEKEGVGVLAGEIKSTTERPQLTSVYTPASTATEQDLADIWAGFFGFEKVGVNDDFFELGGDSLKAVTMLSQVQRKTGTQIPLAEVFKRQTIRELAKYLGEHEDEETVNIKLADKQEFYRLSSAQERLYIVQQMDRENTGYNLTSMLIIEGKLDQDRLEKTFCRLIERHDSLRTGFDIINGEPVQRVYAQVDFQLEIKKVGEYANELSSYPAPGEIPTIATGFIRPFDLAHPPLLRVGLVELSPARFLLMFEIHHIISDGWSMEVMIKELVALYQGENLPGLRVQYTDYSEWQNRLRETPGYEKQKEYWHGVFAGEWPVLELPTDFVRPAVQSFAGETIRFDIEPKLTDALKRLAHKEKTTLFSIMLAVYYVFLSKLSSQEAMIVGTPVAGRNHPDLEQIIGMFANTLAIPGFPSGEKSFIGFIHEVNQQVVNALANQDYPFEELVRHLGDKATGDRSRNPLFDVAFSLTPVGNNSPQELPELSFVPYEFENKTSKFDCLLSTLEGSETLYFSLEYCTRLFKETTIVRLSDYFKRILVSLVDEPGQRLGDIDFISAEDKERIVWEFNDTTRELSLVETLDGLFAGCAEETPDRVALVGESLENVIKGEGGVQRSGFTTMTYKELNRQAGVLATGLQVRGVGEGHIVAIMIERSLEMITAILGILKTGAAYLPLDLGFPGERVRYMCMDSGAKVVITRHGLAERFPYMEQVVMLDREEEAGKSGRCEWLGGVKNRESNGQSGAYVIYTSGTTGRPKGVYTIHTNAIRVVKNTNYIDIQPDDRLLQWSNYAFDGSVFDIYGALINKAALLLVPHGEAADIVKLAAMIKYHQVTVFFITTALFNALIDTDRECLGDIRQVLFGGERVSVEHTRRALEITGRGKILHMYGPTETTVYSTCFGVDTIPERAATIPIGSPISNTTVYVLSRQLKLLPLLVTGELYIGGPGLARGYLNNPDMTSEKFVKVSGLSLDESAPGLFYKTGDLARWLSDGTIEFIGRVDQQVKVRGFRIELGEIENRLRQYKNVKETVVVDWYAEPGANTGEKYLCAYIVRKNREAQFLPGELKDFLLHALPAYMVPAFFIDLETIPLDRRSGKLDRQALPHPAPLVQDEERTIEPLKDEIEEKLAELWAQVLGMSKEKIGGNADFFSLGGHSIKATLLAAQVHRQMDVDIPLREILRDPCLRSMASYIKNAERARYESIEPVDVQEYYELSPAQKRMYVLQQMNLHHIGYNMPFTVPLAKDFDQERLERTFQALIARHESLRTSFIMMDNVPVQVVHDVKEVNFKLEIYHGELDITVYIHPFDLAKAPLLRGAVIKDSSGQQALFVDMHHIISDGTSQTVLINDFNALYNNEPLASLCLQYKDFSEWQNRRLREKDKGVVSQQKYWTEVYKDAPDLPHLNILADRLRPNVFTFEGGRYDFAIESEQANLFREVGIKNGATLYMNILAALNTLFYKYTGQEDIIIGAGVAGRTHPDLFHVIGMFINTLAMRNFPQGRKTYSGFLSEVKEKTIEAYANQELPFEELVERIELERDPARNPLFDVFMVVQNFQAMGEKLGEKGKANQTAPNTQQNEAKNTQEPGRLPTGQFSQSTAKFDLTFYVNESDIENGRGDIHRDIHRDIHIYVEYYAAIFNPDTIQRMVSHFKQVVATVGRTPTIELGDIAIITEKEKQEILIDFNNNRKDFPLSSTLDELFEIQAGKTPDRIAVKGLAIGGGNGNRNDNDNINDNINDNNNDNNIGHLGYRELLDRSNCLAYRLVERGVGPGAIVGLMTERSLEMIIGIMAILKAGNTYMPIDPKYPVERIEFMLADSCTSILVTTDNLVAKEEKLKNWQGHILLIEKTGMPDQIALAVGSRLSQPSFPAYAIYTSGTTGHPKGVLVEHRHVVNLVYGLDTIVYHRYQAPLTVSLVAPYVFDASVQQVFAALLLGHCLLVVPEEVRIDGQRLVKFYLRHSLDISDGVPVTLRLMLENGSEDLPKLPTQHFIIGGEALHQSLVTSFLNCFNEPVPVITNVYGPTECCVDSTWFEVTGQTKNLQAIVPIGRPMPNEQVLILNKEKHVQPIGIAGEIYIAGQGVGRGYLNRPDLTVEKYVEVPRELVTTIMERGRDDGELMNRVYQTGDLGRWLADGTIEFLGRMDRQVKIRGFRIELGEVENCLRKYKTSTQWFNHGLNDDHVSTTIKTKPGTEKKVIFCSRCVLSSHYPGISFDSQGVCNVCREYEQYEPHTHAYFKTPEHFQFLLEEARKTKRSTYDCLLLFSGGKDSSYVLYRLVEMGLKVLAFTFDNGFISDMAFANIKRITSRLGVDSIICRTKKMDRIFLESINRDKTVCTGCFKALTTISTHVAVEKGINLVITGLSRGQIFDTKLFGLFQKGIVNSSDVDEKLLEFRKFYHSTDDKTSRLLSSYEVIMNQETEEGLTREIEGQWFGDDVFKSIHFVDFFRYEDVPIRDVKRYLESKDVYWQQPGDTGFCSTNCIINDVGIYTFTRYYQYHNYAAPLSWDFRMGKITREEALAETAFEPDEEKIKNILNKLGFFDNPIQDACVIDREDKNGDKYLCAYIITGSVNEADIIPDSTELRDYLSRVLPAYMIPSFFIPLEKLPLTAHGKIDRKALPLPGAESVAGYKAPVDAIETRLAEIWKDVLGIQGRVSVEESFFKLGGHSLNATTLATRIHKMFDVKMPIAEIFRFQNIRSMAAFIRSSIKETYISIEPAERKIVYRLSSAQRRLYLLHRMDPGNMGYNVPVILLLEGEIDKERFLYAFKRLILRHESLRTSFFMVGDEPVQQVHDEVKFAIDFIELAKAGDGKRLEPGTPEANNVLDGLTRDFIRPFDLTQAPLLRVGLVMMELNRYLVMMDMHHIITDGVSFNLFTRDLMAFYSGIESILPSLKVQYKDFAEWQNGELGRENLKKQEEYWLNEFTGEIPVLQLPTDYPRPSALSLEGKHIVFNLGNRELKHLETLVHTEDATLFIVLLSAFYILLARISGQEDIVIGTAVAGRMAEELEPIIGMFVNMLPIRNLADGDKYYQEFLRETREKTLAAYDNQSYQYEELVEKAPVSRDPGRNPIFDVVFALQDTNVNIPQQKGGGITLRPYPFEFDIAKFDLAFVCGESEDDLWISVQYSTKLFKESTIQRFIRYYKKVISGLLGDRERKLGRIDILSEEEKREIMGYLTGKQYNQVADEIEVLHHRFEEQVERTPQATAVILGNEEVSYDALNQQANRLANKLHERGIGPDQVVGVMMDVSTQRIAATLGVLKSGGAYLPLDPDYPGERIRFILDDADSRILLTDSTAIREHSFCNLQGVDKIANGLCCTTSRTPIQNLDSLPAVNRGHVNYDKYNRFIGQAMVKHAFSIMATRGCPYNCAYCHKIWPKKHVFRSADHLYDEVSRAYDIGIRRFAFIDDIFNLNDKNSRNFFQKLIQNNLKVQLFFPSGLRGDILTPEYMDLMVEAGTVSLAMALETASPRLQKLVGKNLNLDKLKNSLEYFAKNYPNIILELFFMHGFPTETEAEAKQTLDFVKSINWLHFPYFHILKIFPNTDMANLAMANGISEKTIRQSANMAYHELPLTLPFDKRFTLQLQADFLNGYFLNKERLLHVLPYQMQLLTENELVQKYDSYLPITIKSFSDILNFAGIKQEEIDMSLLSNQDAMEIQNLNKRIREVYPFVQPEPDALRILLLDLSQFFSTDNRHMLYDVVEAPLGLMSLMTALENTYGTKINGKIAKSRIDFDTFTDLKNLISDFKPHIIGMRTLTYYKDFFHQSAALIRQWGFTGPMIAGGPYATSDYTTLLNDGNIDLVVLGEGEQTLVEIIGAMLDNHLVLPVKEELNHIDGIAYINHASLPVYSTSRAREVFVMDGFQKTLEQRSCVNLPPLSKSYHTAYVIYTSGTTGRPKGVMVEHRNVISLMDTGKQLFDYGEQDTWTMFHNYCFDFSVWEMYGSLLFGGKLVLVPRIIARDPKNYVELILKQQVTILNQTPTVFYQLIEEESKRIEPQLNIRWVIFGGEALKPGKLLPWVARYPATHLINMYGITETTVHVTFKEITSLELKGNISNIGRPIDSLSVSIMNRHFQSVPWNVPGEMLVGGQGVARGYLNRPELTAERFIADPETHTRRLYRSGDLARLLDNGEMEYMGRIDHQVKIRGNRVETGEIERLMLQLQGIREVVVIARQDENGDNYLCAYLTTIDNHELTVSELRETLSKRMPGYMLPSYFIQLDLFPVTSSGKVDSRKLPLPQGLRPSLGNVFTAPETEISREIAAAWQEVLGLEKVGIFDNFFDLGGTSLEIVKLNSRLKEILGRDIPIVTMFEYPTIDSFAAHLGLDQPGTIPGTPPQPETKDFSGKLQHGRAKMKGRKNRVNR